MLLRPAWASLTGSVPCDQTWLTEIQVAVTGIMCSFHGLLNTMTALMSVLFINRLLTDVSYLKYFLTRFTFFWGNRNLTKPKEEIKMAHEADFSCNLKATDSTQLDFIWMMSWKRRSKLKLISDCVTESVIWSWPSRHSCGNALFDPVIIVQRSARSWIHCFSWTSTTFIFFLHREPQKCD